MNILFLIFIILAYVNLTAARPLIEDNPDKYLEILNKERLELAKKFNISNMHKLHWSIELSLTAHKVKCPCTASNYTDLQSFVISDKKIITGFSDLDGYQLAQPLQTVIGCNFGYQCDKGCDKEKDKKDTDDQMDPEEEKVPEVKFTKFGLCFIGPYGNPSMAHFKTGKSLDCGDLPTDKGLCDSGAEGGEHKAQALTDDKENDKKAKEVRNGAEEAYQWLISMVIFLILC